MFELVKFVWNFSPTTIKFNLTVKAAVSTIVSFLDICALFLFAQLFSSLVQNDVTFFVKISKFLGVYENEMSIQNIYFVAIVLIIFLVLTKSILILVINRMLLETLARTYAKSSKEITTRFFNMCINQIKAQPSYEIFLAVNSGVRDILIIGTNAYINIFTELIVVATILTILVLHGGMPALVLGLYFAFVFFVINKIAGASSKKNSEILTKSGLSSAVTIQAIVESFRELKVFNSLEWFLSRNQTAVENSSSATADMQFVGFIPKIILESTFITGIVTFTWYKISNGEIATAVIDVGFLVAMGTRIIPSLLRLQFSLYQIKQVMGSAMFTLKLLEQQSYQKSTSSTALTKKPITVDAESDPRIVVDNVTYSYPDSDLKAISNFSLIINEGESVGIVGRTGSGKSTLIDLLLGVNEPSSGRVRICGMPPADYFRAQLGRVGFVPQNICLIDGSLRENLLLGRDCQQFIEEDFRRALDFAGLNSHIDSLQYGLETFITRAGSELSGGQRQKLGIARAVLTQPSILILDEVTSSLDAESEGVINGAISKLRGKVTLIVVAHRLTTIKSMDRILLMENGNLAASGNYESLAKMNQTFKSFVELSEL
jgi:ATP-binding cassette subfamily C protein